MTSHAWPFVVGRNSLLDWRPIIAPRFMIEDRSSFLLTHQAVHDPGSDLSRPALRLVRASLSGDLTIIYRTIAPTTDSKEALCDRFGRPISLVEGVVVRGEVPDALVVWGPQLSRIDKVARGAFEQFWGVEDEGFRAASSSPLFSRTEEKRSALLGVHCKGHLALAALSSWLAQSPCWHEGSLCSRKVAL